MQNWDEAKTAFHVARLGTVSGAAEALGVHHATVIRHIDALETHLGVKLFQRHARGYTPTEAGQDLLRVAQTIDAQFSQLEGRLKGRREDVSGELVVTSLAALSAMMAPVLTAFQAAHPQVIMRYLTGERLFRLEYGEAHVALRAGRDAPDQPDNVVQLLCRLPMGLYASKSYAEIHGLPGSEADLKSHSFIGSDLEKPRAPHEIWLKERAPREAVRFRSPDAWAAREALINGAGLGFLPVMEARALPDLIEVFPSDPAWTVSLWLVTHVDLHRSVKVQTFLTHLKEAAKAWEA